MTTNVYDGNVGVVATDSRWSHTFGRWLIYVDDVPFEKIEVYRGAALVFAGKGRVIQRWKDWLATAPKAEDMDKRPSADGISVCVIDTGARAVLFHERQDIARDGAYFAGSGARFAFGCWSANRDAKRSVVTATVTDPATGGEVKFLECVSGVHNLRQVPANRVTIDTVDRAVFERGMVMDISTKRSGAPPFKLSDLAVGASAGDADLAELKRRLEAGEVSADAPCDSMHSEWSAEELARLDAALVKAFKF
jgi:hypothetical protein